MRGEADASFGTIVDQNFAREQFAANGLCIRHINGDGAAALVGIAWRVHAPAVMVGGFDQAGRLPFRFFADLLYAHLFNDLQARTTGFERGNMRRSVHKAQRRSGVAGGTGRKLEGIFVGEPSGQFWFELRAQIRPDIEIPDPWSTAQPFENASETEVDVEGLDID